MNAPFSYENIVELCGNKLGIFDDTCPLCSHTRRPSNRKKKSMRLWLDSHRASWCCQHCRATGCVFRNQQAKATATAPRRHLKAVRATDTSANKDIALKIWHKKTKPLNGTLGASYFTVHRRIDLDSLGDLSHALRWHQDKRMIVALMRDVVSGEETGIHRIFLNPDGTKHERKMLGQKGVICLSPFEDVAEGLGLSEGIEHGLAVLASGWKPIWAAPDAGFIANFPVLAGIESITIFADADPAGRSAAEACANRWQAKGLEAWKRFPQSDDNT